MLGLLFLVLAALPGLCHGGIVVLGSMTAGELSASTNNMTSMEKTIVGDGGDFSSLQGSLVVSQVTMLNPKIGRTVHGVENNLTALVLADVDSEVLCAWLASDEPVESFLLTLPRFDMIVTTWGGRRCYQGFMDRVCKLTDFAVNVNWGEYPGILSTYMFKEEQNVDSCSFLEGRLAHGALMELEESIALRVQLSMDKAEVYELFTSFLIQFIFRGVVPCCYLFVAVTSVLIYRERKIIHGIIMWSHAFVLGLNASQGLILAVLNFVGLHAMGSTFHQEFIVVSFANYFSLSVATDLIFTRLLRDISLAFKFRQHRVGGAHLGKWLTFAVVIISVEFVSMIVYVLFPGSLTWAILTQYQPLLLTFFSVVITGSMVILMRQIAAAIMNANRDVLTDNPDDTRALERAKIQMKVAKAYYFWTKISVFSVTLSYIAGVLIIRGFLLVSPTYFLAIISMLDISKILNMLAQSFSCRTPSSHPSAAEKKLNSRLFSTNITSFKPWSKNSITPVKK